MMVTNAYDTFLNLQEYKHTSYNEVIKNFLKH